MHTSVFILGFSVSRERERERWIEQTIRQTNTVLYHFIASYILLFLLRDGIICKPNVSPPLRSQFKFLSTSRKQDLNNFSEIASPCHSVMSIVWLIIGFKDYLQICRKNKVSWYNYLHIRKFPE